VPKLVIEEGGQQSVFELFEDEATIGRGAANAIQVADSRASKQHAVVRRVAGRIKLVDLESKNGTRVNGEFRNQRWLESGDVISIGDLQLTYDGSEARAAAAVPAAPHVTASGGASVTAPTRPHAPRSGGSASGRSGSRRARDGDDEDDDRGRRGPARRKDNSAAIGILVGAGVLVVGAGLFYLISHSGAGSNAQALQQAKQLYRQGHRKEALELLEREGDPSRADEYVSVDEQIKTWRSETAHEGDDLKSQAAMDIYKKIDFDRIEQWKNHLTDVQLGQRLLNLAEEYKGTLQVMELLNSQNQPYPKLRDLMEKAKAAPK